MHMAQTTIPRPRYTHGQRVEVLVTDFDTPGFPKTWMAGIVAAAEPRDDGAWDMTVIRDRATAGNRITSLIVGKRGGNKRIRAAV